MPSSGIFTGVFITAPTESKHTPLFTSRSLSVSTSTNEAQLGSGVGIALAGLLGAVVVDIWATVDAVRVAKVNNLAWRDNYKPGAGLRISPDLKVLPG